MKAQSLILSAGFVLVSLFSYGQPAKAPQKGYYSIYRNAEKLETKTPVAASYTNTGATVSERRASKGYFAIGNRREVRPATVLVKSGSDAATRSQLTPVVTKGYYSIGRNAEKLQ